MNIKNPTESEYQQIILDYLTKHLGNEEVLEIQYNLDIEPSKLKEWVSKEFVSFMRSYNKVLEYNNKVK